MKKTIKLAIVFVVAVMLCMLFAVFASAESVKVEYYNTDGGSRKATEYTAEDGSITLKDTGYDTTAGKEFYGWFTVDGTFYAKGETVTFTKDTKLMEATAYLVANENDFKSTYNKNWHLVKLTADLTFTSRVDLAEQGIHFIDLNGHTITFNTPNSDAIWIKRGGIKFYNFADTEANLVATSFQTSNRGLFLCERHSYGDGSNLGLTIGKNVKLTTNGAAIRVNNNLYSYTDRDPDGLYCPWVNIYGTVEADTLVRTSNERGQNYYTTLEAPITIGDGAYVKLSGESWWMNPNLTTTGDIAGFLYIRNATIITTNPNFQWELSYQYIKYDVTGGSYNVKIPDGFIQENYACVYNAETGLYDLKEVPCTLEGSNGVHTFKVQEPYKGMATTCESDGYHYYRCMCGAYYVGEFKAYGHDFASVVIKEVATATKPGVKEVTCQTCQYSYTFEYSFDPRDQIIAIVVKTADGTKEISVKAGDLYNMTVESTLDSFSAKITSLKAITDPDNAEVTYAVTDIVKAVIPTGVNEIATDVFKNNSNLKEIILNDGANLTFASGFVENCPNLELIEVGDCTVVFSKNVIDGAYNNLTVDVSKANATFKDEAFIEDSGLKKLLMGSGRAYDFGASSMCKVGLEEFIVPDNTTSFKAAYATFYQTASLKYVYIGRGITELVNIFDQSFGLQKVVLMDVTKISGDWFCCLANQGEDVLRIYHHASTLSTGGKFLHQSHGVIFYTNAVDWKGSMDSCKEITKTVNGVQVTYPAYTIVKGIPHEYKEGGVDATCTVMGSTGYTTDCPCGVVADATFTTYKGVNAGTAVNGTTVTTGEIVAGETTPALGHEFDAEKGATVVATTPATCIKNATTTYKCARCDEKMTVETPDSALGHDTDGVEWEILNNATCAADGLKQKTCKTCKGLAVSEIIPAFGHQASGEWVTIQEATCSVGATRVQYCKNENCEFVALKETTEPNGHTPSAEWTVVVPADCLKAGEKENRCTVCRAVIDTVVIDAFGHEFDIADGAVVNAITYANGFDKNGVAFTKCARCDETSEGEVAPIFEAKGYALNSDRTGLNGGYKINTEMLLAYETINGSLNFGIVIANANSFGGAKFFNDENKVNSEKSIVAEAKERGFSSFDCSINGFGAHAGTLELVITMYVVDADGNVTYVQAVNNYANAVGTDKIADGIFTSVTLDLVRANIPEVASSYALLPSNDEE